MTSITISRTFTDNVGYKDVQKLKEIYWQHLDAYPIPLPPANAGVSEMLNYFKRKEANSKQIGCYTNITVFEAANRIATDLVIINGVLQLFSAYEHLKNDTCTLRLGTRHEKAKGDFTIGNKEGEAFNVAPSFLKTKLRSTLKKWKDAELGYILINAEVAELISVDKYEPEIIKVQHWDRR